MLERGWLAFLEQQCHRADASSPCLWIPLGKAMRGGKGKFGALRRFWANLAGHLSIAGAEGTGNDVPGRGARPPKAPWLQALGRGLGSCHIQEQGAEAPAPGPLARDPCPSCRKATLIALKGLRLLSNPAFAPP